MTTDHAPPRATRREWVGLAVLALPTLLVSLDLFVMLLAVPHVSAAAGAGVTLAQGAAVQANRQAHRRAFFHTSGRLVQHLPGYKGPLLVEVRIDTGIQDRSLPCHRLALAEPDPENDP